MGRLLLLGLVVGGQAPVAAVDVLLVLAVDGSESVSTSRFQLQMRGYAAAFRDPEVRRAIVKGGEGRIGVVMFQWTGPTKQKLMFDWRLIDGPVAAEAVAAEIEGSARLLNYGGTSIRGAVVFAMGCFERAPWAAERRVIDVSGDGANNDGGSMIATRDAAVAAGVVINGLPITSVEPGVDEHYRDEVIGGRGAFMIAVDDYDDFAEAIRRKLVTEIAGIFPRAAGLRIITATP